MQEISTNNLNVQVVLEGHPDDETIRLGKTFNQMIKRVGSGVNIQKQFIADASHELMTPLTRSLSSLEIAQDSLASKNIEDAQNEISYAKDDIRQLGALTQSLLLLSKLETDPIIKRQIFSPYTEIANILGKNQPVISDKDIEVELEIDKNLRMTFPKDFFEILLSNLITNAIKYNKINGKITIKGQLNKSGKIFHIEISDTGRGMTQETIDHIFDRFYRGENIGQASGFGIGMALVKRIIDITNSEIQINSSIDSGTTVLLDFSL